jgi:signal transduction histidine kinase
MVESKRPSGISAKPSATEKARDERRSPPGSASVAHFAVSDRGTVLSSDPAFAALFAIRSEVAKAGASVRELVRSLEEAGDDAAARLAALLEDDSAVDGEIVADDGRIILWHRTSLALGQRGSLFSFHEVGRERAALRALRDAENWLHLFAEHTGGAVLELDVTGRVVGTWSTDGEILAMPEASLQGRALVEVLGGKYATDLERLLARVFATAEEASLEYTVESAGRERVFAITATLLASESTSPTVSLLVRDITEQTRMQTQLVQAERLASVGLLAAGVAHEINNPLTYMVLNFQRVRRGLHRLGEGAKTPSALRLTNELEQCIDMMVEGAERVQQIVKDLQRFSRSDRGESRELTDVRKVLDFTLGLVTFEIGRHARLVRDFRPVPEVLATDGRLSQVFLNLILNAVQALPAPDPELHEIRLVTMTDDAGNAVVEVHDTGIGIPPQDIRKVFDPFYTTKPPNVGTGLGLAICHGITRSLGGAISVDSKVGVGTVFRVVLPPASSATE